MQKTILPTRADLRKLEKSDDQTKNQAIQSWKVHLYESNDVCNLEIAITAIQNTEFHNKIQSIIELRNNQLKSQLDNEKLILENKKYERDQQQLAQKLSFEREKFNLEKDKFQQVQREFNLKLNLEEQKYQLDRQKFTLQQDKQIFSKKVENRKLKIEYVKNFITLFSIFFTVGALFSYLFQAPQFAVAAGGQIKAGQVNDILKGMSGTLFAIITLVIVIGGIYTAFSITEI